MAGPAIGFSGLRSRLSDISIDLDNLAKEAAGAPAVSAAARPANSSAPPQSDGAWKRVGWITAVLVAIGLFVWAIGQESEGSSSTTPLADAAAAPAADAAAGAVADAAAAPFATPLPDAATEVSESMPPAGVNLQLDANQVAYCLAEEIRMTAAQDVVDRTDDTQVDWFNTRVADFNSRCGSYRYLQSNLDAAQLYVDAHRSELVSAGLARLSANAAAAAPQSDPLSADPPFEADAQP